MVFCLLLAACGEKTTTNTVVTLKKNQPALAAAPKAPVFIAARKMEFSRVGMAALRADSANEVNLDTVRGKFLVFRKDRAMRFLYRVVTTDTVWTEIELALPNTDSLDAPTSVTLAGAALSSWGPTYRWAQPNLLAP
jgi:hypothetical protein